jgi:conjugal transfer pilus assembly protein TraW
MARIRDIAVLGWGLVISLGCAATDLGNVGPTYDIAEPNLLEVIHQRLIERERSGELHRLEDAARARATNAVLHPVPAAHLVTTTTPRTFYFDPTFTLEQNLIDEQGRVLFPAGTRKNPLEVVTLSRHLLFFDGRDPQQVRQARALIVHYDGRVKPILVAGSYLDLMKAWQAPVYYDQQGLLTRRLGITQVPALVSQEGLRLRIDEMAVTP